MSFLDSLIKDPKYQSHDPRTPEQIGDEDIIISPDTRRDNRIPPGQSRTKKWPVLDAHGTPPIDLTPGNLKSTVWSKTLWSFRSTSSCSYRQ